MLPSPFKAGDQPGSYQANRAIGEQDILNMAKYLARQRLRKGRTLSSPDACFDYLQMLLQDLEHEVFGVIYLDQQHRIISHEILFRGTINQATVYPREIIKQTLSVNAAAVILFHNHPSGHCQPSSADDQLTDQIQKTLKLIEVRMLDHIVFGQDKHYSYATYGKV